MQIEARVFSMDGQEMIATHQQLPIQPSPDSKALFLLAEKLGEAAAMDLTEKGAGRLIDRSRKPST
jgi:hypothetical protein